MVQIYNEITIYFYKAIFSFGGFALKPLLAPRPPSQGDSPLEPCRGGTPPLYSPMWKSVRTSGV